MSDVTAPASVLHAEAELRRDRAPRTRVPRTRVPRTRAPSTRVEVKYSGVLYTFVLEREQVRTIGSLRSHRFQTQRRLSLLRLNMIYTSRSYLVLM